MKTWIMLAGLFATSIGAYGQGVDTLTLDLCYARAEQNYPLVKQRELIAKARDYSVANAARGNLPVVTLYGQETYQSAVTEVPFQLPEADIPELSKHQYKVYGDVTFTLYDGGITRHKKQSYEVKALVEEHKLETELYRIKEKINQLYFGILLLDGQLKQNDLLLEDIKRGIAKTEAAIANGTLLISHRDVLRAEGLRARQRSIELKASRKAYLNMLGLFLNETLNERIVFAKPVPLVVTREINRPELLWYDHQKKAIDVEEKMLQARNYPRIASFLQVGAGRPGLNMLSNDFESYYVGGIRLSWNLSGFYTQKNQRMLLEISRRNIDVQRETFLFNTQHALYQQRSEADKYQDLLVTDNEIVALRKQVKNTAAAQLENGMIDSNDYLREVNAEDQAIQNKILHEIQWLMALYTKQTTAGI